MNSSYTRSKNTYNDNKHELITINSESLVNNIDTADTIDHGGG